MDRKATGAGPRHLSRPGPGAFPGADRLSFPVLLAEVDEQDDQADDGEEHHAHHPPWEVVHRLHSSWITWERNGKRAAPRVPTPPATAVGEEGAAEVGLVLATSCGDCKHPVLGTRKNGGWVVRSLGGWEFRNV